MSNAENSVERYQNNQEKDISIEESFRRQKWIFQTLNHFSIRWKKENFVELRDVHKNNFLTKKKLVWRRERITSVRWKLGILELLEKSLKRGVVVMK